MRRLARRLVLFALAVSPSLGRAEGPCAAPSTSADLLAAEDRAERAYADLDLAGFSAATDVLAGLIPCTTDPVSRDLAAAAHRLFGLREAADQHLDRARLAFAAARTVEPEWRFPATLLPPGHPLRALYAAFPLELGRSEPLPPTSASLRFDGRPGTSRPASWPTLVQVFSPEGAVLSTAYLWPDDPLPPLPPPQDLALAPPTPAPSAGAAHMAPASQKRHPWALVGMAGLGGAAALGTYAAATETASVYRDPSTNPEARETLRTRTDSLVLGSGALAALTAGTMLVAMIAW